MSGPAGTAGSAPAGQQAYFEPLGRDGGWERFHAGGLTASTWGPELQHGAPPSALLARAIGRHDPRPEERIARIAVDLLGAVPLGEVRTRARVARPGRRIRLLEAELLAGERVVARASAWAMRRTPTQSAAHDAEPARGLAERSVDDGFAQRWSSGFIDSLELRQGPGGEVWARTRHPLVAGEEMTPLERVLSVADIANGVGAVLDPAHWRFLNTDLVVHLHRESTGDWIGIDAEASIGPDGIGTTSGTLFDARGAIGRTEQALLVEPA